MFYVSQADSKKILDWDEQFQFWDILNEKHLLPKDIGLTPRQIELLTKFDYFDNSTRAEGGWRRFSLIEASAIHCIHNAKLYGLDREDIEKLSRTMLGKPASPQIYTIDRKVMTEELKRGSGKSAILASILGLPMNLVWSHADPCLSPLFCSEERFQEDFRTKFDSYFKIRIDTVIDTFLQALAESRGDRYFSLVKMLAFYCEKYPWLPDEEKRILKILAENLDPMIVTFGASGESITLIPQGDREMARNAELRIISRLAKRESQQVNIKILRRGPKETSPQRE